MSYITMAEREYVWHVGKDRPDQDWILSDRDVWYKNPHFKGVHGPHPEDYSDDDCFIPGDDDAGKYDFPAYDDSDIPF